MGILGASCRVLVLGAPAFLTSLAVPGASVADTLQVPKEYPNLEAAVEAAADGDTLLVSPGTYRTRDRNFVRTELRLVIRSEGGADATILDAAGWTISVFNFREQGPEPSVVEGFTIRNYSWFDNLASAVTCRNAAVTIRDCRFESNFAPLGGAAQVAGSGTVRFDRCHFEENQAGEHGGAVWIESGATATFSDCVFQSNASTLSGGAVAVEGTGLVWMERCLLAENASAEGGGLALIDAAGDEPTASLTRCTLVRNRAERSGGAVRIAPTEASSPAVITTSVFWENQATTGAAFFGENSFPITIECSRVREADLALPFRTVGEVVELDPRFCLSGGEPDEVYAVDHESPLLPDNNGCGVWIGAFGEGCESPPLGACCLEGDCFLSVAGDCEDGFLGVGSTCDGAECDEGACCLPTGECRIVAEDACEGTFLGSDLPCDPSPCPLSACCLPSGECRLARTVQECDALRGCFRPGPCDPSPCDPVVWRVPGDAPTIQAGIALACEGDTVLVAAGTYEGPGNHSLDLLGKALTLISEAGPEMTVLDGGGTNRLLHVRRFEGGSTRIEGFTIRNGFGGESGGGGLLVESSSPTLVNCHIIENTAVKFGGGVAAYGSWSEFRDCWIAGNQALGSVWPEQDGGGVYTEAGQLTLRSCVITGNVAAVGAGVAVHGGQLVLDRCTIASNEGIGTGGGLFSEEATRIVATETIFWGNAAFRGPDVAVLRGEGDVVFGCCALEPSLAFGDGIEYGLRTVLDDPLFCDPARAAAAPTVAGDYRLAENSSCLGADPNCPQIGALGIGCEETAVIGCCAPDGTCRLASPARCLELGFESLGVGSTCEPSSCEQPGACCFLDGDCVLELEEACAEDQGEFGGSGSACAPNPCPQPGACCLGDGCDFRPMAPCLDIGGAFLGEGEACTPYVCEPNREVILLLHATGEAEPVLEDCQALQDSVDGATGLYDVWVVAAHPPGRPPRVARLTFGVDYDPDVVEIVLADTFADTVERTEDWPAPGSGVRLAWVEVQVEPFLFATRLTLRVVGGAATGIPGGPDALSLIPHPELGAIVDDDRPETPAQEVSCLATLGIGAAGSSCCWSIGACCLDEDPYCVDTTFEACDAIGHGYWAGPFTDCDPLDCFPAVALAGVEVREDRGRVEISWHAESDRGIAAFAVLRSRSPDSEGVRLLGDAEAEGSRWRFQDPDPMSGISFYWIEAREVDGLTERFGPWEVATVPPRSFHLSAARPNPSTGLVELDLYQPETGVALCSVHDASGRRIRSILEPSAARGWRTLVWDGRDEAGRRVPSGLYFVRVQSGTEVRASRVLLVRP